MAEPTKRDREQAEKLSKVYDTRAAVELAACLIADERARNVARLRAMAEEADAPWPSGYEPARTLERAADALEADHE